MNQTTLTTATIALNGIDVTYATAGSGPPVVLVHGLGEDRQSWRVVQESLTDVTTHAYDLRGHGATGIGAAAGTLAQLRDDLVAFLGAVTGPAVCVGFSLGGAIVLSAAAYRPDLVKTVVALGTSSVVGRGAKAFYTERIELFRGSDTAAKEAALLADTAAALHDPHSDAAAVTRARLTAVGDAHGYLNASTAMARLADEPLTPALSAIPADVDVHLIGADHDSLCPRKAAQIVLDAIHHATYAEISGAGHLMLIDQPEQVLAALRQALTVT
ncbi:alpha/beta fold hydrolase [Mycolicibacterium mengxianglii]|uniref:alpha/beta fold hydrolase n=1 Tax=Mycolicibacterium mengxianglii TaxID=2736649 RepID=UPI001E48B581|nr:alpha/beta hydrolase [Mycolicibacterium mengxianglii]